MHLFISPHLDDAALSCGATIRRLTANGQPVTIMTITSGDAPPHMEAAPLIALHHARWRTDAGAADDTPFPQHRRTEDIASAAVLGAQVLHLPLLDAIYRVDADGAPMYYNNATLFGDIHPDDPLPAQLAAQTLPATADAGALTIYAPLGVGRHIDHQITRDWALNLSDRLDATSLFYEEYPYCAFDDHNTDAAIDLLLMRDHRLEQQLFWVSEAEAQAKAEAIACHRSQFKSFWGDPADQQAALRDGIDATLQRVVRAQLLRAGRGNVLAERYWRKMS
jgi:LmbE family N-acetylglucosaminyl deacetylase